MLRLIIIDGPNLNLTGYREPDIYGIEKTEDFLIKLRNLYPDVEISYYQSNIEGELINKIQECNHKYDGIIINAGGYTHTSVAIADAISAIETPVVEVHLSNILAREEFRHKSLLAQSCIGVISGFGMGSYYLAVAYFVNFKKKN